MWLNIVWDKFSMGDRLYTDWWSHTLYRGKKKMKLQRGDKTFMACLEHIPWCIRLCSLDVERSGEKNRKKKAGGLFAALRRARRQKLAASKLQWGRWQCELRNSASLKTAGSECKDSGSCLSASRFLCWHLMAAAIKGKKGGRCRLRIDFALLYFVNYLYVNAPLQLCEEGGLVLTLFSQWMIITGFLFDIYLH